MNYVYIINSINQPQKYYTGYTTDLGQRLNEHNSGKSTHTNKYRPWKLMTYIAFETKEKALKFETYLKTGSGRAFAAKHMR